MSDAPGPPSPSPYPAGWYPHPDGTKERFWDGTSWTEAYRPMNAGLTSSAQAPYHGPAIASMVLGIVSIVFWYFGIVTGIIGLILGVNSLKSVQPNGPKRGRGMAITGIVCSIVALALWTLVLILVIVAASSSN